jgi:hypothetical protein
MEEPRGSPSIPSRRAASAHVRPNFDGMGW